MRYPQRLPRRLTLVTFTLAALTPLASVAGPQAPGIENGPGMRLSGSHSFVFSPSSQGGTITWSVDRETISDTGVHARTSGIASATGSPATFSLTAVRGSETIYY